jgi:ribonuclease HII
MQKYDLELSLLEQDYKYICGIDEVGRGALFGPVVAGAVILNPDIVQKEESYRAIDDSKKLSPKKRQLLAGQIYMTAMAYSIGWCWNDEIDSTDIVSATKKAMKMAVRGLQFTPDYVLMDGMKPDFIGIEGAGIIKGDNRSLSIAAASIIAKVFRDQLMVSFAPLFPDYRLEKHKGYLTRLHMEAISQKGRTLFHRNSFKIGNATWQTNESLS